MRAAPWKLVALAVGLALAVAAASCGGGDDREAREAFVRQMNAECTQFTRATSKFTPPQNLRQLARYMDRVIPLLRKLADDVAALEPPDALEEPVAKWVVIARQFVQRARALRRAAATRKQAEVERIRAEGEAANRRADELAGEIGALDCVEV